MTKTISKSKTNKGYFLMTFPMISIWKLFPPYWIEYMISKILGNLMYIDMNNNLQYMDSFLYNIIKMLGFRLQFEKNNKEIDIRLVAFGFKIPKFIRYDTVVKAQKVDSNGKPNKMLMCKGYMFGIPFNFNLKKLE